MYILTVRYDQLSRSPGLTPVMVACIKCHNGNEWEGTGDGRWEEECSLTSGFQLTGSVIRYQPRCRWSWTRLVH